MVHDNKWWAVYRLLNRQRLRSYNNNYYHQKKGKERAREYYHRTKEERREASRLKNHKNRKDLLFIMGNKCMKCSYSDWRALQIDHIHGGGRYERMGFGHSASALRNSVLKDLQNPEELRRYQLLCANCNWIKRHESKELFWDKRVKI